MLLNPEATLLSVVASGFSRKIRCRPKPIPGIRCRQLRRRLQTNRPLPVRRAFQGRIVVHDDDAVAGEMHVELETVGAEGEAVIEGREGVLRPQRRAAAMGVDEGTRQDRASQISDSSVKDQGPSSKGQGTPHRQFPTQRQNRQESTL